MVSWDSVIRHCRQLAHRDLYSVVWELVLIIHQLARTIDRQPCIFILAHSAQ